MRHQWLTAFLLLTVTAWANAEQTAYSVQSVEDKLQFSYVWIDADNQPQTMEFSLLNQALAASPSAQMNYRPALAMRFVTVKLLQEARLYNPKDVNIQVHQQGEAVSISVQSRNEEKIDAVQRRLREVKETAFDEYLYTHYYTRYRNSFNQERIKPDHTRYIRETQKGLIPLSQAFYEKINTRSDAREYINLLLGWVQNIPYDPILNRSESNGSGFAPPAQLLVENKGDCDSKSVLTAAIIRAFLPDTPMVLILLPEHALLGIALTPLGDDETLTAEGKTYVLFEPTGPALFEMGKVADSTALALAQRRYTVEEIQ
ncbi:hypothetical protein [Alteromonas sp. C1M14]|uniref:hypothetical protein n=1 Tax=Alteromonas sp. C1M14 TaxID=2841567 RepID=UPI001C095E01|nr:hypothetical protein [Alteromonas sp. C1M14]MBU2977550.1 hypothetical protein [Alteromonas sp. C1M14]